MIAFSYLYYIEIKNLTLFLLWLFIEAVAAPANGQLSAEEKELKEKEWKEELAKVGGLTSSFPFKTLYYYKVTISHLYISELLCFQK